MKNIVTIASKYIPVTEMFNIRKVLNYFSFNSGYFTVMPYLLCTNTNIQTNTHTHNNHTLMFLGLRLYQNLQLGRKSKLHYLIFHFGKVLPNMHFY